MIASLALACLWLIAANLVAMMPSRDKHWRAAYVLVAVGIPILGYVTWVHGPWIGLLVLAGGVSVLRWPVYFLGRWMLRLGRGRAE